MLCELGYPPNNCSELTTYVQDMITLIAAKSTVRYGESTAAASSDELTALWMPCDPPDCAVAVWYNTTDDEFEVWGYISGTWRQTGAASKNSPYYTEFEGVGGLIQEGWSGGWLLDGEGNVYPKLTLGPELLTNEDFEEWTGGNLDDWTVAGTDTEEYTIVKTGSVSAHITRVAATASVSQAITATAGRWYLGSAWGYHPDPTTIPTGIGLTLTNSIKDRVTRLDLDIQWHKQTVGALVTASPFSFTVSMLFPVVADPEFYVDTASVKEITSGWCIYKNFYSDYGTCYVDITLVPNDTLVLPRHGMGLLFNYLDDDNYCIVILGRLTGANVNVYVYENNAGTVTLNNSYLIAYVDGARLEVLRDSLDQLTIDYDGVNVVTGLALATPVSSPIHGIVSPDELSFASAFGYTPE